MPKGPQHRLQTGNKGVQYVKGVHGLPNDHRLPTTVTFKIPRRFHSPVSQAGAHRGHGGGAVGFGDVALQSDGVGKLLMRGHHRRQGPLRQHAMPDLRSPVTVTVTVTVTVRSSESVR
eukprot:716622-Prorocentrum_minimum.AAC.1